MAISINSSPDRLVRKLLPSFWRLIFFAGFVSLVSPVVSPVEAAWLEVADTSSVEGETARLVTRWTIPPEAADNGLFRAIRYSFETRDNTAVANEDYEPVSGTITWRENQPGGEQTGVEILILEDGDPCDESYPNTEKFDVLLTDAQVEFRSWFGGYNWVAATVENGMIHFLPEIKRSVSITIPDGCPTPSN
ncbi:MAG: hypothetical protein OXC63_15045 [Aestuariivita sp.]|nr:hypothetical protein [Aestuariivita sp.]MCY4346724.1 hypothetical protein [Aestuariivita sp.]